MRALAVFITWLLIALQLYAQSPQIDSLYNIIKRSSALHDTSRARIYIDMANRWSKINPDSALFFANLAYQLSAGQNFRPGLAESRSTQGWVNINMGRFLEGNQYYQDALQHFSALKDERGQASVYNGLGVTYGMQENFPEALRYFLKALVIFEKNSMKTGMASCYIKIGTVYEKIHEYDKSLYNYQKAIELAESVNDKVNMAHGYNNIGVIFGITRQYEKSIAATLKAKQLAEETHTFTALANSYTNLGMAYTEQKQYNLADSNLHKGLYYLKQLKNQEQIARTYNGLATLYLNEEKYREAKVYIDSSNAIANELNNKSILFDNYDALISISKAEGKFETATALYEQLLALKDTLFNAEKNTQVEKLKASYDLEKKQVIIESLKRENVNKTKQRNNLVLAVLIGGLLLMLLVISFVKIKKKNKLLHESKKELKELNDLKDKFFSVLSHDLRSPIGNILLVIDFLHADFDISKDERVNLFKKLKSATTSTLETLDNMLAWGKYQSEHTVNVPKPVNARQTLERVSRLLDQSAQTKSITIINNIDQAHVVHADEHQFEFILRNLVSNALKFSHAGGKLEVWARRLDSSIFIYVRDYGIGMSQQLQTKIFTNERVTINGTAGEIGSGLGLALCQEYIAQNKGTLTVKSEVGKGTTFVIKLPSKET
jgi:signal transduction histidine kinase